ncbi:ATP-dependent DNA helicase Q5 [Amazona aestiva]|uniref:ATP-dependent DNA helicase Q5 n=1 Tax=Amazona aestiva TaxID=12930 RepID=A0A0Q3LRK4_AMAAE|nr:ATP-dependent DNA helicase Q5 [Amazona aestiva]
MPLVLLQQVPVMVKKTHPLFCINGNGEKWKYLILNILPYRCRHAAIAKYFGDVTPLCNKCCDYCKNPAAVKRQRESLERYSSSWSRTCIGPMSSSWEGYDPELYEGGRRGCRGFSRYDEESSGNGDEANEESRKREWNNFYKKQMSLRRGKEPENEDFVPPKVCPARNHPSLCYRSDPHACAVELEYEAFRTSKMANSYKATVLKKFKRKRVGAGFPRKSSLFQTASELLKIQEKSDAEANKTEVDCPNGQDNSNSSLEPDTRSPVLQKKETAVCESAGVEVLHPEKKGQQPNPDAKAALLGGPNKKSKRSKKQQMLTEAAKKESQDISKFFSLPKGGSKAKSCSSAKEGGCSASTLLQVSSQREYQEKAIPQENKDVSGEGVIGQPQAENEELEEAQVALTVRGEDFRTHQGAEFELLQEETDVKSSADENVAETELTVAEEGESRKRPGSDEDLEIPAAKLLRTAAKCSILSQPESRSVSLTKKKVTFDPNLLQCDKEGTSRTIQTVTKAMSLKETADIVVKYLTPFYKDGKFASKDLFKGFARHLSHLLTEEQNPARKTVKEEAQRLIKEFFKSRVRCESETDWQELQSSES